MSVIQDVLGIVKKDLLSRSNLMAQQTVHEGINLVPDVLKTVVARHNGFLEAMGIVFDALTWFENNPTSSSLPDSFKAAGDSTRENIAAKLNAPADSSDDEMLDPIVVTTPPLSDSSSAL